MAEKAKIEKYLNRAITKEELYVARGLSNADKYVAVDRKIGQEIPELRAGFGIAFPHLAQGKSIVMVPKDSYEKIQKSFKDKIAKLRKGAERITTGEYAREKCDDVLIDPRTNENITMGEFRKGGKFPVVAAEAYQKVEDAMKEAVKILAEKRLKK